MNKQLAVAALSFVLFTVGFSVHAQQSAKVPRIAYVGGTALAANADRVEAFKQGLRELGYVEGKNIVVEWRFADGEESRLPALVAELVRLKIDIIVAGGPSVTRAAQKATSTIPIVMGFHLDPVGSGAIASLARPGGNITGLSTMAVDLNGKRLELLKEAFPKVARVAFLWQSGGTDGNMAFSGMEAAAKALRLKLLSLEVRGPDDFDSAFARAKRDGVQALIASPGGIINTEQRQVLNLAAKNRLPAMYPTSDFVEAGGLMSYAPNLEDLWRRAADYVDKILKGTKPADIPVEQPTKFEFIVNLKSAKQIGVTVPPNVLARADRVIK